MHAYAVVSDSGTLPEESAFFASIHEPFPAVSIRTSTERYEAMEKGCFVLAGIDTNSLVQAVELAIAAQKQHPQYCKVEGYTEEDVSMRVVKILQSYTGIIHKKVWNA